MEHQLLYLASSNPGKLREFREAAALRNVTVAVVPGFAEMTTCIEDGDTFEENALKKALYYSRDRPGIIFADDSGLCVDALDGAPGIYSARFAGLSADDELNNSRLLAEIQRVESLHGSRSAQSGKPQQPVSRSAHYICAIALAHEGRALTVVEGRVDGVIIDEPTGTGGFGYDPYFYHPPLGKTFGEISAEAKFAVSHRGAAFRKLLDYLSASEAESK